MAYTERYPSMALHIKTFTIPTSDGTIYADLQYAHDERRGWGARVRLTRRRVKDGEKPLGYGWFSQAGEIVDLAAGVLSTEERAVLEAAIRESASVSGPPKKAVRP